MIGAVLAMLVLADGAMACSCAPQAPAEALRESDAAVVARLVKVVPHGKLHADYRYDVRQVYRGAASIEKGQVLTVRSGRSAASCALPRRLEPCLRPLSGSRARALVRRHLRRDLAAAHARGGDDSARRHDGACRLPVTLEHRFDPAVARAVL